MRSIEVEPLAVVLGMMLDLAATAKSARVRADARRDVIAQLWALVLDMRGPRAREARAVLRRVAPKALLVLAPVRGRA